MARYTVRIVALAALSAALAISPTIVRADPPAPAPVAAGDFQPFIGSIAGDDVYVRSGPTEAFYATTKLNKGDRVTVVGVRGADNDYLKIVPPDGSFCYVAKNYIELTAGSAMAGKVTKSDLIVRAGSSLNSKMTTMLMKLDAGDAVQLVGTQDESKYYKIAPPAGAYLYVKKTLVAAVPNAGPVAIPLVAQAKDHEPIATDPTPTAKLDHAPVTPPAPVAVATPAPEPVAPPVVGPAAAPTVAVTNGSPAAPAPMATATPTTKPAIDDAAIASATLAAPATTRPTVVARATPTTKPTLTAREQFDRAETEFAKLNAMPLEKQPLDGLKWRYKTLAKDATLPTSLRQTAASRQSNLALRIEARTQQIETTRVATEAAARQKAADAERLELQERVRAQEVATYAAVGTLRISSLQQSGTTLYRLTDPNTGRTVIYVRSNDPKYTTLLNQFVGVRGMITQDNALSLRYVTPTDVEPVDVAKVNNGIMAAVTPPSLVLTGSTPTAGAN